MHKRRQALLGHRVLRQALLGFLVALKLFLHFLCRRDGLVHPNEFHIALVVGYANPALTIPRLTNTRPHCAVNFQRQEAQAVHVQGDLDHAPLLLGNDSAPAHIVFILASHRGIRALKVNLCLGFLQQ